MKDGKHMPGKSGLVVLTALLCVSILWGVAPTKVVRAPEPTIDAITVPGLMNYQGKLTDTLGNPVPNGTFPLTFRLYHDSTGGASFWSEVQQVQTRGGLFNCLLGKENPIASFPEDGSAYLEMQIDPNPPMAPRIRIASSAYAFLARKADTANYAILGFPAPHNHLGENWTSTTIDRGLLTKLDRNTSGSVYGTVDSSINAGSGAAYGGSFVAEGEGTGTRYGIAALARAPAASDSPCYGVYGYSSHAGNANVWGGSFAATGYDHGSKIGVAGAAWAPVGSSDQARGVDGYGVSDNFSTCMGGNFMATGSGGGIKMGVHAYTEGSGPQYAGYFDGDLLATGIKNAVVKVGEHDWRKLYCQESPEVWFEDVGEGQLQTGHAHIELDPTFLKTVTTSSQYPMQVFVQLCDDCKGVYVQRGLTGFDVIELQNGTSNAHFTYRVMAKRKGYENARLTQMAPGSNPEELRAEAARREAEIGRSRKPSK